MGDKKIWHIDFQKDWMSLIKKLLKRIRPTITLRWGNQPRTGKWKKKIFPTGCCFSSELLKPRTTGRGDNQNRRHRKVSFKKPNNRLAEFSGTSGVEQKGNCRKNRCQHQNCWPSITEASGYEKNWAHWFWEGDKIPENSIINVSTPRKNALSGGSAPDKNSLDRGRGLPLASPWAIEKSLIAGVLNCGAFVTAHWGTRISKCSPQNSKIEIAKHPNTSPWAEGENERGVWWKRLYEVLLSVSHQSAFHLQSSQTYCKIDRYTNIWIINSLFGIIAIFESTDARTWALRNS